MNNSVYFYTSNDTPLPSYVTLPPDNATRHPGITTPPDYSTATSFPTPIDDFDDQRFPDNTPGIHVDANPLNDSNYPTDRNGIPSIFHGYEPYNDSIVLRDIPDLSDRDRTRYSLENLALLCLCIRDHNIMSKACNPVSTQEALAALTNPTMPLLFTSRRHKVTTRHLAHHRAFFHGPVYLSNMVHRRLTWICHAPQCHFNLLPREPALTAIPDLQTKVLDNLDNLVEAIASFLDKAEILNVTRELISEQDNIVRTEMSSRYSHYLTVLGEAFNDHSFYLSLKTLTAPAH
jgi:hypothetical protein